MRRAARAVLDCGLELTVVTGAYAAEVSGALAGLPLRCVHNPQWQQGMGGSIACGVRALAGCGPPPRACLLCLADQPLVGAEQLQRLLRAHAAEPRAIIAGDHGGGVLGAPCLFPAAWYPELAALGGAKGARVLLDRHAADVIAVATPEAAIDVDVPADHARVLSLLDNAAPTRPHG